MQPHERSIGTTADWRKQKHGIAVVQADARFPSNLSNKNRRFSNEEIKAKTMSATRKTVAQPGLWLRMSYSADITRRMRERSASNRDGHDIGDVSESTSSLENLTKQLLSFISAENRDTSATSDSSLSGLLTKYRLGRASHLSTEKPRSEEDRQFAAREASLLASEAALESARQRALERRNLKLVKLRARMQARHEQVEARKRELEVAQRMRMFDILERHNNGAIKLDDLVAYGLRKSLARLDEMSPFVWNHSNTNQSRNAGIRRPVIPFGSTTPRLVCLTTREMLSARFANVNNANVAIFPQKRRAPTNTSVSSRNVVPLKERLKRPLERKVMPTSTLRNGDVTISYKNIGRASRTTRSLMEGSRSECHSDKGRICRKLSIPATKGTRDRPVVPKVSKENYTAHHSSGHSVPRQMLVSRTRLEQADPSTNSKTKAKCNKELIRETTLAKPRVCSTIRPTGSSTRMTQSTIHPSSLRDSARKDMIPTTKKTLSATLRMMHPKDMPQKLTTLSCGDTGEALRNKMRVQCEKTRKHISEPVETTHEVLEGLAGMLVEEAWQSAVNAIGKETIQSLKRIREDTSYLPVMIRDNPSVQAEGKKAALVPSTVTLHTEIAGGSALENLTKDMENQQQSMKLPDPPNKTVEPDVEVITMFSKQEIAEREERKRRLELVMLRLKNVRKATDCMRATAKCSESLQGLLPLNKKSEITSQSQQVSPTYSTFGSVDDHNIVRPNSSASISFDQPVPPCGSLGNLSSTELTAVAGPNEQIVIQTNVSLPPATVPSSSSNRTTVVANLLASGRLAATSRAATVLLNMASRRSPVDKRRDVLSSTTAEVKDTGVANVED
ncbi:hypothetical protein CSKR_112800 [Clonorchis sinensis]|uniref:Uncharacterized protein n=1 Tax=Clonorchis sinensis TaxID=79923 RepID=A0A8T1MU88_CLOSI|nr:hypothetical protein CSKR_112800 [Clonorchis sinensis]